MLYIRKNLMLFKNSINPTEQLQNIQDHIIAYDPGGAHGVPKLPPLLRQ